MNALEVGMPPGLDADGAWKDAGRPTDSGLPFDKNMSMHGQRQFVNEQAAVSADEICVYGRHLINGQETEQGERSHVADSKHKTTSAEPQRSSAKDKVTEHVKDMRIQSNNTKQAQGRHENGNVRGVGARQRGTEYVPSGLDSPTGDPDRDAGCQSDGSALNFFFNENGGKGETGEGGISDGCSRLPCFKTKRRTAICCGCCCVTFLLLLGFVLGIVLQVSVCMCVRACIDLRVCVRVRICVCRRCFICLSISLQ